MANTGRPSLSYDWAYAYINCSEHLSGLSGCMHFGINFEMPFARLAGMLLLQYILNQFLLLLFIQIKASVALKPEIWLCILQFTL